MARSRNIKPGFFLNDTLADISALGRLLFIGLWTIADFKGCLVNSPRKIKAQVLPYDECDVAALLINLEQARFIRSYVNCGKSYIKIVNFEAHQNPHKNERDAGSDIPEIDEKSNEINELKQDGTKPDLIGSARADSGFPHPDSLILIPDSEIKKSASAPSIPELPGKLMADFLKVRKAKHAPLTETAIAGIRREAEKAGLTMVEAITECVECNWQGFRADWHAERKGKSKTNGQANTSKYAGAAKAIWGNDESRTINA